MKRPMQVIAAVAVAAATFSGLGSAIGPFDKKLSSENQIIHALNRLTFGPRPGDIEEVRRIGLNKWIEMQLHPDQIAENSLLEARLKPLETLRMEMAAMVRDYTPQQNMGMMILPPFVQLNRCPTWFRLTLLEHGKLLSQKQILGYQGGTRGEEQPDERQQVRILQELARHLALRTDFFAEHTLQLAGEFNRLLNIPAAVDPVSCRNA